MGIGRHLGSGLGLAGALLGLAALSGCNGPRAPRAAEGTVLRVPQNVEPTTLDPARVEDGPTIEMLMSIFEGLVQWSGDNKLAPCLATSWDVSADGRTYTFHIRPGVKYHNGRLLTAEDFVYSLTRSLDPATLSPVASDYLNDIEGALDFHDKKATSVKGLSAPDPQTLKITIDHPKAYFLAKLTYPTAYAVCKEEVEKTKGQVTEASLVGTGAFKLAEYLEQRRISLDANPDYWDGAPKLKRVERLILKDPNSRHDKFAGGELDLTDVTAGALPADEKDPKLKELMHKFDRASVYYVALNQKAFPPFHDKRVRQALAYAIDKKRLIQTVLQGIPRPAEGILPYGIPGFDETYKGIPFDPAKAKQLLAAAGYPNGAGFPPLTLSFRAADTDIRNTTTAIQADLESNLGIKVALDEVEWGTFLDRRKQGTMPFYFLRWAADYLDPQDFLSMMLHSKAPLNTIGYANPAFDQLCEQADVNQNQTERMAQYRKAEAMAVDDAPWIPIYFQRDVELWNPKLREVTTTLFGHLPYKRTYFQP